MARFPAIKKAADEMQPPPILHQSNLTIPGLQAPLLHIGSAPFGSTLNNRYQNRANPDHDFKLHKLPNDSLANFKKGEAVESQFGSTTQEASQFEA